MAGWLLHIRNAALLAAAGGLVVACTGTRPAHVGSAPDGLAPCPATPNCVSSDSTDEQHRVEPFRLAVSADAGWLAAAQAVRELPRTLVVTEDADYLHAECTSAVMRYVDDLELRLDPEARIIEVRSASRIGRSDFGVNRKRVEQLRATLTEQGVLR
jgi:uncharacterized protein (DUF1499 family)